MISIAVLGGATPRTVRVFPLIVPVIEPKGVVLRPESGEKTREAPVRITLDPYPGVVYHGTVKEVAAVAKPANVEGVGFMQGKNSFTTIVTFKLFVI